MAEENEDELNGKRLSYLYKIYSISTVPAEKTTIAGYISNKLANSLDSLSSDKVSAHDLLVYVRMLDKLQWETDTAKNNAQTKLLTEITKRIGNMQSPQGLTEVLSKQALLEAANVLEYTPENQDAVDDGQVAVGQALNTAAQENHDIADHEFMSVYESDRTEILSDSSLFVAREAFMNKLASLAGWENRKSAVESAENLMKDSLFDNFITELQAAVDGNNLNAVADKLQSNQFGALGMGPLRRLNFSMLGLLEKVKFDIPDDQIKLTDEERAADDNGAAAIEQKKLELADNYKKTMLANAVMRAANDLIQDHSLLLKAERPEDFLNLYKDRVCELFERAVVFGAISTDKRLGDELADKLKVDKYGRFDYVESDGDKTLAEITRDVFDKMARDDEEGLKINPIAVEMDTRDLTYENKQIELLAKRKKLKVTSTPFYKKTLNFFGNVAKGLWRSKEKTLVNIVGYGGLMAAVLAGLPETAAAATLYAAGYGAMSALNTWFMPAYDALGREMNAKGVTGYFNRLKYRASNLGRAMKEQRQQKGFWGRFSLKVGTSLVLGGIGGFASQLGLTGSAFGVAGGQALLARQGAAALGRGASWVHSASGASARESKYQGKGLNWFQRLFYKGNEGRTVENYQRMQTYESWKRGDKVSFWASIGFAFAGDAYKFGAEHVNIFDTTNVSALDNNHASDLLTRAQEQGMLGGFADDKTVMVGDTEVKVSELTPEQIASLPLDEQHDILKDIIKADNTLDNVSELSARIDVASVENPAALLDDSKDLIPSDGIAIGEGESAKVVTADNLTGLSPEEQRAVLEEIINAENGIDNLADLQNHADIAALDDRELVMLANAAKANIPAEGVQIGEKTITSETDISTLSPDEKRVLLETVVKNNEDVTLSSLQEAAGAEWTAYEDVRTLAADIRAVTPIVCYSQDLLPVTVNGQEVTSENMLAFISDGTNGEANRLNLLEAMINKPGDYVDTVADLQNHAAIAQLYDNELDVNPRADALFRTARDGLVEGVDKDVVMIKIGEEEAVKLSSITDEQWHALPDETKKQVLEQIVKADGGPSTLENMEASVDEAIEAKYAEYDGSDLSGNEARMYAKTKFAADERNEYYTVLAQGKVESLPEGMSPVEYMHRLQQLQQLAPVAQKEAIDIMMKELKCDGFIPSAEQIATVQAALNTIIYDGSRTIDVAVPCAEGGYTIMTTKGWGAYIGSGKTVEVDGRQVLLGTTNYATAVSIEGDCDSVSHHETIVQGRKPDCPSCEEATYINGGEGGDIALGDGTVDASVAPRDINVDMTDPYAVYRTAYSGAPSEGQNQVNLAEVDGKVKGVNGEYLKVDDRSGFHVPGTEQMVERGEVYVRAPVNLVSTINNLPASPENAPIVTDDKITFVYPGSNGTTTFEMTKGENGTWRGRFMTGNQEHILDVPSCRALAAKVSEYGMFRVHSVDGAEQSLSQDITISDKHQATLNANAAKDATRDVRAGQPYTPETTTVSVSAEQIRTSIASGQTTLKCTEYNPSTGRATFEATGVSEAGKTSFFVSNLVTVTPQGEMEFARGEDGSYSVMIPTDKGNLVVGVNPANAAENRPVVTTQIDGQNVTVLNAQCIERGVTQVLSANNIRFNGDESIKLHSPLTEKVVAAVRSHASGVRAPSRDGR